MIILKNETQDNFTRVSNSILNDERISWKAKGILSYLMSKPNDWIVRESDLVKRSTDNKTAYRSGLNELIELGYIEREQSRTKGKFKETVYTINISPQSGFEATVIAAPVNQPLSNTDSSNTNNTNISKDIPLIKEYNSFIEKFNGLVNTKHKATDKVKGQFKARIKDGYTLEDMERAIKNARKNEFLMGKNDSKVRYLTPSYILREDKLDEWSSIESVGTKARPAL